MQNKPQQEIIIEVNLLVHLFTNLGILYFFLNNSGHGVKLIIRAIADGGSTYVCLMNLHFF